MRLVGIEDAIRRLRATTTRADNKPSARKSPAAEDRTRGCHSRQHSPATHTVQSQQKQIKSASKKRNESVQKTERDLSMRRPAAPMRPSPHRAASPPAVFGVGSEMMCHRRLNVFSHNNHQTNNGRKTLNPLNTPLPPPGSFDVAVGSCVNWAPRTGPATRVFPFEWTERASRRGRKECGQGQATGCVVRS
jgi:hypothetical protein